MIWRSFIFTISILLSVIPVYAQNLVNNPSFEEFINFASSDNTGWHKVQDSDTPDYFNSENSDGKKNIFNTYTGGAKPKSGKGFIGIFCYRVQPQRNIRNIRELIETQLSATLKKDSLYRIEVSLCLDGESNVAIKNFGILFSGTSQRAEKDIKLTTAKPQIDFTSFYLDNTQNWITLQSFYKAEGNEKYIVLGNFKTDRNTTFKRIVPVVDKKKKKKWDLTSDEKATYYYIDDIVVEKSSVPASDSGLTQDPLIELADTFNIDEIKLDSAIVLRNINFDFNKYELLPESFTEINKLIHLMKSNPGTKIKLEGHTDNFGTYEFNLKLSLQRAESVASYLIHNGIYADRIKVAGYSFSHPLVSNETDEGRRINRRVSFVIIEK